MKDQRQKLINELRKTREQVNGVPVEAIKDLVDSHNEPFNAKDCAEARERSEKLLEDLQGLITDYTND